MFARPVEKAIKLRLFNISKPNVQLESCHLQEEYCESLHILQNLEHQFVSMQVFALTHFLFTSVASVLSACWRKQHAVNSAGQM